MSADAIVAVWLVSPDCESDAGPWMRLLLDASAVLGVRLCLCGRLTPEASSLTALRSGPEGVLLVHGVTAAQSWSEELQALGKGVVVVGPGSAEERRLWSEIAPVVFVSAEPGAEALGLAILSAEGASRREATLQDENRQLQQRVQDRGLIERAKGLLVERLGLGEPEAYRRLRGMARRQRRPLGEVARAVLDAEALLDEPAADTPCAENTQP